MVMGPRVVLCSEHRAEVRGFLQAIVLQEDLLS